MNAILKPLSQFRYVAIAILAILLCLSSSFLTTAQAQGQIESKADIVLDGRRLFEIGSSGNFSAATRAEKINSRLLDKVQSANASQKPEVTVAKQFDWTVIRVDNRHLMTVVENDLIPGTMPEEQAKIWQDRLNLALDRGIYERSPQYLQGVVKTIAITLGLAAAIQFGLFVLKRHYSRKRVEVSQPWYDRAILGIICLQTLMWLLVVGYCIYLLPQTRNWLYLLKVFAVDTFNSEFGYGESMAVSLHRIIVSIVLCILWWLVVSWFSRLLRHSLLPLTGLESTRQSSIAFLTRYGLLFLGIWSILNASGIDLRSLTIVISALGVGIGFGLQSIAKDFISGVILTLTGPLKVGELVEVGEDKGLVLHIGARTTEISHVDRYIMTIPNSRFIEETVRNWHRSGLIRVRVYVDVSYNSDRELVYKALLAAAQVYHPDILKHPPPKAKLRYFDERSLRFRVVVFIKDPFKEPKVRNHIQKHIDLYFRKYNIEIPFPQRDINLKVPQLEELVANLARKYAPPQSQLYYPQDCKPEPEPFAEELTIKEEYNWDALVTAMRGEKGVKIADRRYGLRTYHKVFLGTEAVSWLVQYEKATVPEAIAIGQLMMQRDIIHHVLDEHNFKNEPLFYRFYLDESEADS